MIYNKKRKYAMMMTDDLKTVEDMLYLVNHASLKEILIISENFRNKYFNNKIELCSIYNAKSGRCSENCIFCAQSSYYKTNIIEFDLIDSDTVLSLAKNIEKNKIHFFSIVTSGKRLNDSDFLKLIKTIKILKNNTNLSLCASCGFITKDQVLELKNAGLSKYHHNIETSPDFFKNICSTHSFEEKIKTIESTLNSGLQVCSGVILGIGESLIDRIEMAFILKELKIKSIPINILKPIKGTPLQHQKKLDEDEYLLSIALFRIINENAAIKIAGGRPFLNNDEHDKLIQSGINSFMVGNYLTTNGVSIENDMNYFNENNFTY